MGVMIISSVSLALLIACVLYALVKFFMAKGRKDKIEFLRSFKKGKCAVVYIAAIPLYCVGYMHSGETLVDSFFISVSKCIGLIVLKFDFDDIKGLMDESIFYRHTLYFCFVVIVINALILTLSLISQYLFGERKKLCARFTKKDKLFILGNNPQNISIYLSDKERNKVVIGDISKSESQKLYIKKVFFTSTDSYAEQINKIFKKIKKSKKRKYTFIVNTGDDDKNISICRVILKNISSIVNEPEAPKKENKEDIKDWFYTNTRVFVFGQPRYEAIYTDIVSNSYGCIHYINKYQKIAMDFIDKYPITKFMDEAQIDYETSLIKEDIDINVLLIGFGKTNQQLFLTSVANNQFLTGGKNGPELKKVKYFIFDKEETENNKNLNHNYYRYRYECDNLNKDDYLPLPTIPAKEKYYKLDINDCHFYTKIKDTVQRSVNDVNFIIIAFGTDLENIDMAQKLIEKRKEWGVENLVIFVKVRAMDKKDSQITDKACYFIGNESKVVYNIDKIMGDDIYEMAKMRNEVYDLEYAMTGEEKIVVDEAYVNKNKKESDRKWYMEKSQLERESSLYCCLSLRSKLNLMGLDYCKIDDKENKEPQLTEEEYLKIYAGEDQPNREKYNLTANEKPIIYYSIDFKESRRKNMAIHEHQRWNSFMISKGIIPASKEQIRNETKMTNKGEKFTNGKNYPLRRHGNLTTFDGLIEFRKMLAERDKCDEEKKDVIKYDYQLLDDAYWLLNSKKFKIFKIKK